MNKNKSLLFVAMLVMIGLPFILTDTALAQGAGGVGQVESFLRNVIQVIAGLAGLIATGFFVVGGFGYITSSGNPENLDKSKRTLLYSGMGLAITIGAQKHVSKVEFSNDTDNSGAAINPTTTFTANTPKINTVVSLLNVKKGDRVSYTRYLNDKYVDNGGLTVVKDKAVYAGFDFALKTGKLHPIGAYTVKLYVNGDYQSSAKYSVK